MKREQSLNDFIFHLAKRIADTYPSNCADAEDYIQIGHLTLAEIASNGRDYRNFHAYAIIAIANTMRNAALDTMCATSAPRKIKQQVHKIKVLSEAGLTEREICEELQITKTTLFNLRSLDNTKSWQALFNQEPAYGFEPFDAFDDLLSSRNLTAEDRAFLKAQFDGVSKSLGLDRNQRYSVIKKLRPKLTRSGYGTEL